MPATILQQSQTVVTNLHTAPRTYMFLPPHGVTLQPNETFTMDGDLLMILAAKPRKAQLRALRSEIAAGRLGLTTRPLYPPIPAE